MKKIVLLGLIFGLSGCDTVPVKQEEKVQVPLNRQFAFKIKDEKNDAKVIVTRDSGVTGKACLYSVWVDGVLAASLRTKETVTLFIPSGERIFKVARDPEGKGICAKGNNRWTQIESIIDNKVVKSFRLSIDTFGKAELQREK